MDDLLIKSSWMTWRNNDK